MVRQLRLIGYATVVLITAAVSGVAAGPQSHCLVSKNRCVAKLADGLLRCWQKAETPGRPADPNADACVDEAKTRFDGGSDPERSCFVRQNKARSDCVTIGDTESAETLVLSCVDRLVGAIDQMPPAQSKCNAGKKRCAAKKLKRILECHQKAETPGKSNDPNAGDCIIRAMAKYDGGSDPTKGCFAQLEAKDPNDCRAPLGNSAAVEAIVDDSCAGAFVAALETPTTTTTSTTVPGNCTTLFSPCGSCGDGFCALIPTPPIGGTPHCVSAATCTSPCAGTPEVCSAGQVCAVTPGPFVPMLQCCAPCP